MKESWNSTDYSNYNQWNLILRVTNLQTTVYTVPKILAVHVLLPVSARIKGFEFASERQFHCIS